MYNPKEIEKKWQNYWEENKTFRVENDFSKPKYYTLDMFPFPSWAGLHVWHPEWYTANDIVARYKNAKWFNVLHPMWWDAFGLPAENYAIKTGTHPKETTAKNIATFKRQIKSLGISYDWDREIDTTDPEYYKWTQWIFLKMFEKGLAYEQDLPINYCPSCKTGLANEEVLNDFSCERCGEKVEKKKIRQWVLAITKYADRLLKDVDDLDWPESIKEMQRNWIWKSEGCEFEMKKAWDETKSISVYTTRIDTVFSMAFAVIAPDYKNIENFITNEQKEACKKYILESNKKSDQDRTQADKEKTWVFTGSYVINPFNNEKIPIWIWDFVLWNYWTWAVFWDAHDERDFIFAKKYGINLKVSILPKNCKEEEKNKLLNFEEYFTWYWILINSWKFDWLSSEEAKLKLTKFAEENNFWTKKINYKLRDWLFSRQRYWGDPIPLVHLEKVNMKKLPHVSDVSEATDENIAYILRRKPEEGEDVKGAICPNSWQVRELIIWGKVFSKIYDGIYGKIVCDYRLPVELPEMQDFAPAWDGQSPLAKDDNFVNVKLAENLVWKRETNTMPQWGWSCWYYLRYMDSKNPDELVNKEAEKYWGQVDSYVGWAEHAVLHLLYARFWHKFLFDIGVVSSDEPFYRLRNQGLIQSYIYVTEKWKSIHVDLVEEKDWEYFHKETGEKLEKKIWKMSKSLWNVINPDDIIEEYGADSLRLYEMYMAEFKDSAPWDTKNIIWVRRFLEKVERAFSEPDVKKAEDDNQAIKLLNKTIKKVEEDIENYKFNTAIASMMILVNYGRPSDESLFSEWKEKFIVILSAFAPFLSEELWEQMWNKESIFLASWPEIDESMLVENTVKIAVQVLGKVRWTIEINKDESKESVLEKAKNEENVAKWLEGKNLVKEIYVPWKIVNLVVK